jgi:gluconate 2-dehydrogenase gamma chain
MYKSEEFPVLMFFNRDEASTIEAIASRLIPSDEVSLGAKEAGAVIFIDRSLAGFFKHLQTFYRQGLIELQRYCEEKHSDAFIALTEEQQDQVLRDIEGFIVEDFLNSDEQSDRRDSVLAQFFAVVYEHTMEGTFGDPLYGGNRDTIGWKLIGFPGAQWGYTPEQMKLGFNVNQIKVKTLTDIQREHKPVITEVKL